MRGPDDGNFLTFTIGEGLYALPVMQVSEVLENSDITRLPLSDPSMKGLINLRGRGIPVFDLRAKFGYETEHFGDGAIIVAEMSEADGEVDKVGALVDSVEEVVEIDANGIDPAPKFKTRLSADFVKGVAQRAGRFVVIIDIEEVFDAAERRAIRSTATDGGTVSLAAAQG